MCIRDRAKKLEGIKGTQNVSDGLEDADAEYEVIVNKEKAMEYNLTVAQVFQAINKELAEDVYKRQGEYRRKRSAMRQPF